LGSIYEYFSPEDFSPMPKEKLNYGIIRGRSTVAEYWICFEDYESLDYCYGGTRILPPSTSDQDVLVILSRLASSESALKNQLINFAILEGAVQRTFGLKLPKLFSNSRVGGARCVIRPYGLANYRELSDPFGRGFPELAKNLFGSIGKSLNALEGRVKLTPDFGRFAGVSDILWRETEHVLGISVESGGCGGKSSYSATGVSSAITYFEAYCEDKLTLIGAAGAMGSHILANSLGRISDTVVCDLAYADKKNITHEKLNILVMPAESGRFTKACMSRGGLIVATTYGEELERSQFDSIPAGTVFLLAHNLSMPSGSSGIALARHLMNRGALIIPGQILTLGGALTSRLEWFSRQEGRLSFDKKGAHAIVEKVVRFLLNRIDVTRARENSTPYEAMLRVTES
jgi:hypothetical protein